MNRYVIVHIDPFPSDSKYCICILYVGFSLRNIHLIVDVSQLFC
jgi:hypothetical protein